MTRDELLDFMRKPTFWVEASVHESGGAQAAVIGIAVSNELELVFDTIDATRKCKNLRREPRIALVMWDGAATVQVEGVADEPKGEDLARLKKVYLARFADGAEREGLDGITYFRVKPSWIRYSDFSGDPPTVVEFRGPFA